MAQPRECPKCSGSMSEGFVADVTHGSATVSSWVEGAPRKSVWTGLKLRGRPKSEITTFRCSRCGFLENYAPRAPDRSQEAAQQKQVVLVVTISLAVLLLILTAMLVLR